LDGRCRAVVHKVESSHSHFAGFITTESKHVVAANRNSVIFSPLIKNNMPQQTLVAYSHNENLLLPSTSPLSYAFAHFVFGLELTLDSLRHNELPFSS
jgi:hypothetical protein